MSQDRCRYGDRGRDRGYQAHLAPRAMRPVAISICHRDLDSRLGRDTARHAPAASMQSAATSCAVRKCLGRIGGSLGEVLHGCKLPAHFGHATAAHPGGHPAAIRQTPQQSALFRRLDLEVGKLLHDVRAPTPRALNTFFALTFSVGDRQGQLEAFATLLAEKLINWHAQPSLAISHTVASMGMPSPDLGARLDPHRSSGARLLSNLHASQQLSQATTL
jgi:hypothetical protein